jgi:hypothetical protein
MLKGVSKRVIERLNFSRCKSTVLDPVTLHDQALFLSNQLMITLSPELRLITGRGLKICLTGLGNSSRDSKA